MLVQSLRSLFGVMCLRSQDSDVCSDLEVAKWLEDVAFSVTEQEKKIKAGDGFKRAGPLAARSDDGGSNISTKGEFMTSKVVVKREK